MSLFDHKPSMKILPIASLLLPLSLGIFVSPSARAQAAAEAAGASSVSATMASQAKPPAFATTPAADKPEKQAHLPLPSGPPPEVVNRRNLEQHAGRDAAKLLLRSDPTGSQVWINSAFVGSTPMVLVLAPGKYSLELRGPRQEFAARTVDLLPRETREVAPILTAHYPTKVIIR
jgi:hypothetical protein